MSEWQAHIQDDWMRFGVSVVWAREVGEGRREVTNGSTSWIVEPNGAVDVEMGIEPLHLREDMLRALHQALLRHFNGADDARMLRKDYEAERARVDKLIDLATRPPIALPGRAS